MFSWKKLTSDCLCFSFQRLFFAKRCILRMMKRAFQRFLRLYFLLVPSYGGQTFTKYFQNSFRGFCNVVVVYFLENKKSKIALNFCFYHHQVFSKPLKIIRNCKREHYTTKECLNQITCLNWLPLILWILIEVEESNQLMLPK